MARVEIYTTEYCPYCIRARMLLLDKGVEFEEIDVGDNPALRAQMVERAGGRRTVPEIFINGNVIGGYNELQALEMEGRLDALLAEAE